MDIGRHLVSSLVLGLCVVSSTAVGEEGIKLGRGEVIVETRPAEKDGRNSAQVRAVIEAPLQEVWKIIDDCDGFKDVWERIIESSTLPSKGDDDRCTSTLAMPWPFSDIRSDVTVTREVNGDSMTRQWLMFEGDMKHNEGSWNLSHFQNDPNRTLAIYRTTVEFHQPIPGPLQRWIQRKQLPQMIHELRVATSKKN